MAIVPEELKALTEELSRTFPDAGKLMADPDFVAILAKNVKHFLEHGHDTDPLPSK